MSHPIIDAAPSPEAIVDYRNVAVIIPCLNEAAAIADVVHAFARVLTGCRVFVYDNASTDLTAECARQAGAVVRFEPVPGKGGVVRKMFAEVDAAIYVLVDGDGTYEAARAPELVSAIAHQGFDMVTAVRVEAEGAAYRRGHRFGNRMFNWALGAFFGKRPSDAFSGYRALSRRFVKTFPATSRGFEIEVELTVHALQLRVPTAETMTKYAARVPGSASKLKSYRDGMRILAFMGLLFKEVKPFAFFGSVAAVLMIAGLAFGVPVIMEYERTGLVPRLPTAVLATGLVLLSSLTFGCGLILDSVSRGRLETKRLAYLAAGGMQAATVPLVQAGGDLAPRQDCACGETGKAATWKTILPSNWR